MALSLTHRRTIFLRLSPMLGEEETEALLSQLPTDPEQDPVTVGRFDAAMSQLRAEMHTDMARLEASLVERMRQQLMWTFGAVVSGMGIAAAISQAIG